MNNVEIEVSNVSQCDLWCINFLAYAVDDNVIIAIDNRYWRITHLNEKVKSFVLNEFWSVSVQIDKLALSNIDLDGINFLYYSHSYWSIMR